VVHISPPEVLEKLRDGEATSDADAKEILLMFFCPGCQTGHSFRVKGGAPLWEWNGSMTAPTFQPSLLVWGQDPAKRCHLYLRSGVVEYLADCSHARKGTTYVLPGIP
jgi:hypothetical protein